MDIVKMSAKKNVHRVATGHSRTVRIDSTGESMMKMSIPRIIKDRKRRETALQGSDEQYRFLFDRSPLPMLVLDPETLRFLTVNRAAIRQYGFTEREFLAMTSATAGQKESTADMLAEISKGISGLRNLGVWNHLRNDGTNICVEIVCDDLPFGGYNSILVVIHDITERKRVDDALLFRTALLEAQSETIIDGILVVGESHQVVLANQQFRVQFEIPDDLLKRGDDRPLLKYMTDRVVNPDAFLERVRYLYRNSNEKSRDEFKLTNGKSFDRNTAPLVDSNGRHRGRIWYFRDITDRVAAEERIQFLACFDGLTGLPNRTLLEDRLTEILADARLARQNVALLFLDLDQFQRINDSLGYASGNRLLQDVAARLLRHVRQGDTVARIGGDKFVMVLNNVNSESEAAISALQIVDAISERYTVLGHSLHISCCLGISMFPGHGEDCQTLMKYADQAMYSAKENGRGSIRFFREDMNAQAIEQLALENDLRSALERNEFFLVYQPQIEIVGGEIVGFEALIRWQRPGVGLVPPLDFIPIAENCGLILPIGEWVLRAACAQARKWHDDGLPMVSVAVNVSAVQFRQVGFCELIKKILAETGLPPQRLELEVTESVLVSNADVMFSVLQELRDMGLRIAIDDFGTGYSSLSYLKQFPVSKLKIDRSFIRDIGVDSDDAAITTAIINMAKSLSLKVIAEGVETEEQMSFLRAHHCDEIQGYYFSMPLTGVEVANKLSKMTSRASQIAQKALALGIISLTTERLN